MPSIRPTPLKTGLLALVLVAASALLNTLPAQTAPAAPASPDAASATPPPGSADASAAAPPQGTNVAGFLAQGGIVLWFLVDPSVCVVWFTAAGVCYHCAN